MDSHRHSELGRFDSTEVRTENKHSPNKRRLATLGMASATVVAAVITGLATIIGASDGTNLPTLQAVDKETLSSNVDHLSKRPPQTKHDPSNQPEPPPRIDLAFQWIVFAITMHPPDDFCSLGFAHVCFEGVLENRSEEVVDWTPTIKDVADPGKAIVRVYDPAKEEQDIALDPVYENGFVIGYRSTMPIPIPPGGVRRVKMYALIPISAIGNESFGTSIPSYHARWELRWRLNRGAPPYQWAASAQAIRRNASDGGDLYESLPVESALRSRKLQLAWKIADEQQSGISAPHSLQARLADGIGHPSLERREFHPAEPVLFP